MLAQYTTASISGISRAGLVLGCSIPDPLDRERIEAVARDYEKMAEAVEQSGED